MCSSVFLSIVIILSCWIAPFLISLVVLSSQKYDHLTLPKVFLLGSLILTALPGFLSPILVFIPSYVLFPVMAGMLIVFLVSKRGSLSQVMLVRVTRADLVWICGAVLIIALLLTVRASYSALDWPAGEPIHASEKYFDLSMQQSYARSAFYPPDNIWFAGEKVWYHSLHQLLPGLVSKLNNLLGLELCSAVVFTNWSSLFFVLGLLTISAISLFLLRLSFKKGTIRISVISLMIGIFPLCITTFSHFFKLQGAGFSDLLGGVLPHAYVLTPALSFIGGDPHSFIYAMTTTVSFIAGAMLLLSSIASDLIFVLLVGIVCAQLGGHPPSMLFMAIFGTSFLALNGKFLRKHYQKILLSIISIGAVIFIWHCQRHETIGFKVRLVPSHLATTSTQFLDVFFIIVLILVAFCIASKKASSIDDNLSKSTLISVFVASVFTFICCEFVSYDHPVDNRVEWMRFNPLLRHWTELMFYSPLLIIPFARFALTASTGRSQLNFVTRLFTIFLFVSFSVGLYANSSALFRRIKVFPHPFSFDGLSFLKTAYVADADIVKKLSEPKYLNSVILETCGDNGSKKFGKEFSWAGRIADFSGRLGACGWNMHMFRYQVKFRTPRVGYEFTWPYLKHVSTTAREIYRNHANRVKDLNEIGITHVIYGSGEIDQFGKVNPNEFATKTGLAVDFYSPQSGAIIFKVK